MVRKSKLSDTKSAFFSQLPEMEVPLADIVSMSTPPRCFRPALRPYIRPTVRAAYLRFYSAAQAEIAPRIRTLKVEVQKWKHKEQYPRIKKQDAALDYHTFKERYKNLARGESKPDDEVVVRGMSASSSLNQFGSCCQGRISSFRIAGSKLGFLDLFQNSRSTQLDSHRLQCMLDYTHIVHSGMKPPHFKDFLKQLRRGDIYSKLASIS